MARERELETRDWASGLDGSVFSTRDDPVVFETNVEALVRVRDLKSPPKTETDFVPFNCMHEPGEPFATFHCPCRLNEDLITDQHARTLLRETWNRKASKSINSRLIFQMRGQTNGTVAGIRF